jgi:hypothetical protein
MPSVRVGVIALIVAAGVAAGRVWAQPAQDPALVDARQTIEAARKDLAAYKAAGGAAGAADHPAIKWDAALWAYRERYPRSDAATLATAEAVRLLVGAELWDRAHARVESLDPDDPAWARVASPIYDEGIARKDLPTAIERLSRAAARTTTPAIKSSVSIVLARAYRRHGDNPSALRALETAKAANPVPLVIEEADGLIYEITHLSAGLPAPAIAGKTRNGGRAISMDSLRGKPVVLVFWGST